MGLGDNLAALAQRLTSQLADPAMFGSACRTRRATRTPGADGERVEEWATVLTDAGIILADVASEQAARDWGIDVLVTATGTCSAALDITEEDGVIVTGGVHAGRRFAVKRIQYAREAGHMVLGLAATADLMGEEA